MRFFNHPILPLVLLFFVGELPRSNAEEITTATKIGKRIEMVRFHSTVLDMSKQYAVVLPANYKTTPARNTTWPVMFLFHGRGRTERTLIDDPASHVALLQAKFVIILFDGDDGWYIDSPLQSNQRYESYTTEVINHATEQYCLSTHRSQRGLSGWSMGGYGATLFAAKHGAQFSAVVPIIGLLDFPRRGLPAGQSYKIPLSRFGKNPTIWTELNPINHANKLKSTQLLIITADEAFDRTMNHNFADKLRELKIPFQFRQLTGGHTFDVVRKALPLVVDFMNQSIMPQSK
jgi:S-formylglutathione hydrolase FrmB